MTPDLAPLRTLLLCALVALASYTLGLTMGQHSGRRHWARLDAGTPVVTRATTTTSDPPRPTSSEVSRGGHRDSPGAMRTGGPVVRTRPAAPGGDVLACIRFYESRGNYRSVSVDGRYRGAYQADRAFWLSYGDDASLADPPRWEQATPAAQDAMARRAIAARGLQPWPTPSRRCAS